MNNKATVFAAKLRAVLMGVGVLACLVPVVYMSPAAAQEEAPAVTAESRFAAEEMRLIGRQVAASAWQSSQGQESTFKDLARRVAHFDEQKGLVVAQQLASELSVVDVAWQPIKRAAQTLLEAGPEIVFAHDVVKKYGNQMDSMQQILTQRLKQSRSFRRGFFSINLKKKKFRKILN